MKNTPSTLTEAIATIEAKDAVIARLNEQLEWLKRQAFGQKSEKIISSENAIDAFAGEVTNDISPATREVAAHQRNVKGHGRNELPDSLPIETIVIDVSDTQKICPDCGGELCECGEETSRRLCRRTEYFIKETKRIKRACKLHPEAGVAIADMPESYIPKGIADEAVIAHVVTDKYLDHLPLDRQERRFARQDILIGKSTMVDWLDWLATDLTPVVAAMKASMLTSDILSQKFQLSETREARPSGDSSGHGLTENNGRFLITVIREDKGLHESFWVTGVAICIAMRMWAMRNCIRMALSLCSAGRM